MIRKHIAKDGTVTYYAYAPGPDGERLYLGKAPTKAAAQELEAKAKLDRVRVETGMLPPLAIQKWTVKDAIDKFLETYRGRSKTAYEQRLRHHAEKRLGTKKLAALTTADLLDFQEWMSALYAPSTAKSIYEALAMLLGWCVRRGYLTKSPGRGLKAMPVPERVFNYIRTKAEISRLLAACSDEGVLGILAVAVLAGLRQDEIRHLRWDDVDLERRRITVHRGKHGTTKSGKVRHVPILDSLLPILTRWRKQRLGNGLVFPGRDGVSRRGYGNGMWQIFKNAAARAGLDDTLRPHDLRHTFASHWMIDGGDIFKLSKILGHANVVMTMRYAHLSPDAFDADYGRLKIDLPMGVVVALPTSGTAAGRDG